jgi:hypothetical protein
MNHRSSLQSARRLSGETMAFASMGMAGVAMILFALSSMSGLVAGQEQIVPTPAHNTPAVAQSEVVAASGVTNFWRQALPVEVN